VTKQLTVPRYVGRVKQRRHQKIIELINQLEELSLVELSGRLGHISVITLRRDVAQLSEQGLVVRTHGGVAAIRDKLNTKLQNQSDVTGLLGVGDVDAIILPPVGGTGAATLRNFARRRQIPFIAETSEQEGGIYVGHNNFSIGRQLGRYAGGILKQSVKNIDLLMVSSEMLANTRSRCDGFLRGITETFKGRLRHWRVDGQGVYKQAKQVAREAFSARKTINVVFGVNDHSILALLDVAREYGVEISAFSIGGEGASLFKAIMDDNRLIACAALFPELVGLKAIDAIAAALKDRTYNEAVTVPHAIINRENLFHYYSECNNEWVLQSSARHELAPELEANVEPTKTKRSIGFVPHFPSHDWYRNMIRSMEARCSQYGFELRVAPPQADIAEEISFVRRCIARAAAEKVSNGDTIAINAGEISLLMTDYLDHNLDITIITNSLEILERLTGRGRFKVILTSGEYQAKDRCMVGPSLGALFEMIRVDKAFLSVDGLSPRFGISSIDERMALAAHRFCSASRNVFVMADHSIFGAPANHRISPLSEITEIITDRGTLSSDRLALIEAGLKITLADSETKRPKNKLLQYDKKDKLKEKQT